MKAPKSDTKSSLGRELLIKMKILYVVWLYMNILHCDEKSL